MFPSLPDGNLALHNRCGRQPDPGILFEICSSVVGIQARHLVFPVSIRSVWWFAMVVSCDRAMELAATY